MKYRILNFKAPASWMLVSLNHQVFGDELLKLFFFFFYQKYKVPLNPDGLDYKAQSASFMPL